MNEKERYYAFVASSTIDEITKSMESWTSFLSTMGRNYDFSYPEQVMIYAQRPNATLCKEFDDWRDDKLRYVKRGSKGIALFVTDRERPHLRYVFDVADTGERKNSLALDELWTIEDRHRKPIQSALEKTFGVKIKGAMEMQFEETAQVLQKNIGMTTNLTSSTSLLIAFLRSMMSLTSRQHLKMRYPSVLPTHYILDVWMFPVYILNMMIS